MAKKSKGKHGWLDRTVEELTNSKNTKAAWALASILLLGEAVLLGLIIHRVPCTSMYVI